MAKDELKVVEEITASVAVAQPLVETHQEDMLIPFLKVIQAQSDEVIKGKDKYNEAVKAGDIYDGVTRQVYTGSDIVICGIKKYYAEWTPEARGTLIAKHKVTRAPGNLIGDLNQTIASKLSSFLGGRE